MHSLYPTKYEKIREWRRRREKEREGERRKRERKRVKR